MPKVFFIGVDVGTSSARAALVTSRGQVVHQHSRPIKTWNPQKDHYEQSSDNIWEAVCYCVKKVSKQTSKGEIVGISFDATCSLVILGRNGEPITASTTGNNDQNVILWMDHRSAKEAQLINQTEHPILKFVGGNVSLEMQMPKLLWLKNNFNISSWSRLWRAFDLPDYLTWRCTGADTRSLCSVVCKWNYNAAENKWEEEFLRQIGLDMLCNNGFEIIGRHILEPGSKVGAGLTEEAALSLGLLKGTFVGTSLIDAHAGALGMFGCDVHGNISIENKLAIIGGTSTCHMSLTEEPCMAKGIWGPYKNAIFPSYYLNEGGQSAAGALIDYIVNIHPSTPEIKNNLQPNETIFSYLNRLLNNLAEERKLKDICFLTEKVHVWPDFHGNRSPLADPNLRGMISGLCMSGDEKDLAILYLATLQALSYGTRHIIEQLQKHGRKPIDILLFCGGLAKNSFYVQTHADACKIKSIIPDEEEMVLVGSAMIAACAAKVYPSLKEASEAMGGKGMILSPNSCTLEYHNKKYDVFLKMLEHQKMYENMMTNGC